MLDSPGHPSWLADLGRLKGAEVTAPTRSSDDTPTGRSTLKQTAQEFALKEIETSRSNEARQMAAPAFDTVDLFGLPFVDAAKESEVADHLVNWCPERLSTDILTDVANGSGATLPFVITPNVDIVVQLHQGDEQLRASVSRSLYVLPDGWPIVGVSRLVRRPLSSRISGASVFSYWWPQVCARSRPTALLLSSEAVKDGLLKEHQAAVAMVPPMIAPTQDAIDSVADDFVKMAVEAEAEFVVFGLGHPKDTKLALAVLERWPSDLEVPLSFCLGASAEFYLGLKKRAPRWVQRFGLEWLARFVQEPRRMFRRYFVRDLAFFPLAMREIFGRGKQ